MKGKLLEIHFKEDAIPQAVHTPVVVPHHWKMDVKEGLDQDICLGIIEPMSTGTPTTWLSRIVVASKKDGSPRRTMDLQKVNAETKLETHHMPSPSNLVASIPPRTVKIMLDAWNGYHSLNLDDLHYRMGLLSLPEGPPGIPCRQGWLHKKGQ